jgi:hypothetical protein
MDREGAKDVGIRERWMASPVSETRGGCGLSATCDRDGVSEADGGLVLGPAPSEGISARFGFPHVGKVLQGAPMGKYVEKAQSDLVSATSNQRKR